MFILADEDETFVFSKHKTRGGKFSDYGEVWKQFSNKSSYSSSFKRMLTKLHEDMPMAYFIYIYILQHQWIGAYLETRS